MIFFIYIYLFTPHATLYLKDRKCISVIGPLDECNSSASERRTGISPPWPRCLHKLPCTLRTQFGILIVLRRDDRPLAHFGFLFLDIGGSQMGETLVIPFNLWATSRDNGKLDARRIDKEVYVEIQHIKCIIVVILVVSTCNSTAATQFFLKPIVCSPVLDIAIS